MESIDEKVIDANFDDIVKILNYYQDEWKFRQTHFWNLTIKMFTLNLIITILPFVSSFAGITLSNKIPPYMFLVAAIIVSLTELFILLAEGRRHVDVGDARTRINNMLPASYRYYKNGEEKQKSAYDKFIKKIFNVEKHMPESMPYIMFMIQMLLGFLAAVVLFFYVDSLASRIIIGTIGLSIIFLFIAAVHYLRKD